MSYKIAPEDSRFWKCEWMNCDNGLGLAGNGMCSARGEWENKECPKFKKATCEHGIEYDAGCQKCAKKNKEIWDKWDKQEQADLLERIKEYPC